MPSRFGPVDLELYANLQQGRVTGTLGLSPRVAGKRVLLFLRLPAGYRVDSVKLVNGTSLKLSERDGEPVVELPTAAGTMRLVAAVAR